jgi:sugar phosphate permease
MAKQPDELSSSATTGAPDRWLVLGLLAVDYFTLYIHRNVINYVQPPLKADLGMTDGEMGLLSPAFVFPYALAQIGAGYLGDRLPRRAVLLWSLLGSVVVLAAMAFVGSFIELAVLRVLLGIVQATSFPTMGSVIADVFPPEKRGVATGVFLASYTLGLMTAGLFGGQIADTAVWHLSFGADRSVRVAGWRMAMVQFALLGGAAALLLALLFRDPGRTERMEGVGLGETGAPLGATVAAVLRVRTFWAIGAVFLFLGMVQSATQFWLARYLHDRFELSLQDAGLQATFWIQPASVVGLLGGGVLGDRLSKRWIAGPTLVQAIGLAGAAPSVLALGVLDSWTGLAFAMLAFGFGLGLYQANYWTTTFEVVDPAARATALGMANLVSGGIGTW